MYSKYIQTSFMSENGHSRLVVLWRGMNNNNHYYIFFASQEFIIIVQELFEQVDISM